LDSEAPIEEFEDEDEEDEFELVRAADFFFFFGDHGRSEKPSSPSSEKLSSLPLLIMISLSKSAACVCLGKGARPGSCGGLGSSSNENIADGFLTTETRLSRFASELSFEAPLETSSAQYQTGISLEDVVKSSPRTCLRCSCRHNQAPLLLLRLLQVRSTSRIEFALARFVNGKVEVVDLNGHRLDPVDHVLIVDC